jgi:hypothetical protein
MGEDALADRPQVKRRSADPVGERRAIEMNALPLVDLRLTAKSLAITNPLRGCFASNSDPL